MTLFDIHQQLVSRLEALGQGFSKDQNLKLERIEHLLDLLGKPQNHLRFIHVGGTSGKGSVSTLIMNILEGHGYQTGLFTSPYLQVINESCLIGGEMADVCFLSELMDEIEPKLEQVEREGSFGKPSYFETLFALSLMAFARSNVDVAILEVGLGGKLDATNIVDAEISVLTSVGLDHIEILGCTIEEIASDKVQIMKPGRMALCGFLQSETQDIARGYAHDVGADLLQIGKEFSWSRGSAGQLCVRTSKVFYDDLSIGVGQDFQGHNAALAIQACELFSGRELDVSVVEKGFSEVYLPGRGEVLSREPLVIIDGAHNPPKIEAALKSLQPEIGGRRVVVLYAAKKTSARDENMQSLLLKRQQDIFRFLNETGAVSYIFTEFHTKGIWHSADAESLCAQFSDLYPEASVGVCQSVPEAFDRAKELVGDAGVVLGIGSFHLAGEIRDLFYSREDILKGV